MTEKKPSLRAGLPDLKTKEVLVMWCEASQPKYNVSGTKNSHIYIPLEAMPLSLQKVQCSSARIPVVYTSLGHASWSPESPVLICHPKSNSLFMHTKKLGSTSFKSIFNDHFPGGGGGFFTFTGCLVYVQLTQVVWHQNHGPKHTKPQG